MYYKNRVVYTTECENIEIICPVCGYLSRDREDLISIQKEKSCTECLINFKNIMIDEWNQGQRPNRKVARERMNILIEEV